MNLFTINLSHKEYDDYYISILIVSVTDRGFSV